MNPAMTRLIIQPRPRFPLFARVLAWLFLHLVILALAFLIFMRWQLGLGLDSLLSGAAGERLAAFGDEAFSRIAEKRPDEWNDALTLLARERGVTAAVLDAPGDADFPVMIPPDVVERARSSLPPPPRLAPDMHPRTPPGPGFHPPPPRREEMPQAGTAMPRKSRPAFLMRGGDGAYWAGVLLHLPPQRGSPARPVLLMVRSERLDGSGMFFDFKPWLWGGIAVLLLSAAFWTPFVWSISRYLRRLTMATGDIAAGRFQVALPDRGGDELGELGRSIEAMAARLDHLVSGQKRFLGDAAHELCAPLARIRTGLGILEMKSAGMEPAALASIEADVAELAALVNEILAFSRAGSRSLSLRETALEPLVGEVIAREAANADVVVSIAHGLTARTDPALLARAIGNLIRNAAIHAGPHPHVEIHATESADAVSISVTDDGPGVPADELPRIFEPFYRVDRSRSRDTGGSGLGLAIVRSAIETCGGEVVASLPESGGLRITLRLPKHPPSPARHRP
jgi:two-component system sensor histidine kinase CpxA